MLYKPQTPWSWAFLLIAIFQLCVVLAFEGYVFARFQNNLNTALINGLPSDSNGRLAKAQTKTIPTYFTLFAFAHIFLVYLCYDALRLRNTIQIIGTCVFNVAMLVYAAIQMEQIRDANDVLKVGDGVKKDIWSSIQPFLIAIPCIIGFTTVLMSIVCYKLYDEFAWTIYKHISADLRMKKRYLTYQIFIALLKFDFFFFVGFTVQFIVIVASTKGFQQKEVGNTGKDYEFFLTIAVLPLTIVFLLLAAWCTRREKKMLMSGVVVIFFGAMAYFLFKLVRMYQSGYEQSYIPARKPLTTFAVITLLLIVATIINAVACIMNFGKGLKPHVNSKSKYNEDDDKHSMNELSNHASQPVPSRMTID